MRLKQLRKEYQDKRIELDAKVVQSNLSTEKVASEYKKLDNEFKKRMRRLESRPGKRNFILLLVFSLVALLLLIASIALYAQKKPEQTIYSLFGFVLMIFCAFYVSLLENSRLRKLFFGFVSRNLGNRFIQRVPGVLESNLRPVALLHVGIKNYAAEFTDLTDADILDIMSEYFTVVTTVIHKYGGIIYGVYVGNIRAVFDPQEEDCLASCMAALKAAFDIEKVVREKAGSRDFKGKTLFPGMGVHYGKTVIGNIGGENFAIYAPVGIAVKITEKLKKAATYNEIIVSQNVIDETEDYLTHSSKEPIYTPESHEIIRIYRVDSLYEDKNEAASGGPGYPPL